MTSVTPSIEQPEMTGEEIVVPTECPLSHRVARRFFSGVILLLVVLIVAAGIFVLVLQR